MLGHALVWGQTTGNGVPEWLRSTTDPQQFREAVLDAITTEVAHYRGKVDRWDVVNEPLTSLGSEIDANLYRQRLGSDYMALAFRTAHRADPDAKLFLNEAGVEYLPAKADALVALVRRLRAEGVPIDGVGLQTHLILNPLPPGSFEKLVRRFRDLGVEVAVTEMDLPTGPARSPGMQTAEYAQIARECLDAGCAEITTWGVSDNNTWLDDPNTRERNPLFATLSLPSAPLLLDTHYQPKPAYRAIATVLAGR